MTATTPSGATPLDELRYWLALLRAPGVGTRSALQLLEHVPTPRALFASPPSSLKSATRDYLAHPDWAAVDQDLAWLASSQRNHVLTLHDATYPALLKEIPDPPLVLFVHGDVGALQLPQLAMVGSRNPTPGGEENAREFAGVLARAGLVITSGLALGIDAASHRGALDAHGITLAITGTGLDRVYPRRHHALAHEIADRGALVSEFPPGTPPLRENFPRRNRIISGLALGTLVVEASVNSGSLITARLTVEQGREVFAIPGSIHNPLARGCHALIRQGAKLVETAQDVIEELRQHEFALDSPVIASQSDTPELADTQSMVLQQLGYEPTSVDTLVERTGLTAPEVSSILLLLELHGQVVSAAGLYHRTHSQRS